MSENKKILFYIPEEKYYGKFFQLIDDWGLNDVIDYTTNRNIIKNSDICYLPFVPHVEHFENHGLVFDDLVIEFLKKPNGRIFYDVSTESINFYGYTSEKLKQFHDLLKENKVNPSKVFLITANSNAERSYDKWASINSPDYRINVLGINYYIYRTSANCLMNTWFREHYKDIYKAAKLTVEQDKKREKHYINLNLRPRSHRTTLVLNLMDKNLLEKGYVSYFGEEFGSKDAGTVQSIEETKEFISQLPSAQRLLSKFDDLQKNSPITLDRNSGEMREAVVGYGEAKIEHLLPDVKIHGEMVFKNYFEIVTETWFTDQSTLYITEKALRPFIRLQPFVLLGSPNTLSYLKDIGFKTFSPYIDETYDSIEDPAIRMEAIFKEIDRLCDKPIDEWHKIYCELWPTLEHNFNHFLDCMGKPFAQEANMLVESLSKNQKQRINLNFFKNIFAKEEIEKSVASFKRPKIDMLDFDWLSSSK